MSDVPSFQVLQPGQDLCRPRFYMRAVQNNFLTEREGKPVFEDKEYVEIVVPGDRNSLVDRPVNANDKERWPQHYAAFKAQQSVPETGTPLTEWAGVTRSQAEELAIMNVKTVETLAALDDAGLARCVRMGGFKLREKAQRFLEAAAGAAPAEKLAAELSARDAKIAELETLIRAQSAKLDELTRGQTVINHPV